MKSRTSIKVVCLICFAMIIPLANISAQNPLRPKTNSFQWQDQSREENRVATQSFVEDSAESLVLTPEFDQFTSNTAKSDDQIGLVGFHSIEKQQPEEERSKRTPLIGSADGLPWKDTNKVLDLIMKVSLNLVFVLSFAFGVILISRRWMQPNRLASQDRLGGDSLSVLQTLRIDPKISIRLVQWRSNRFLIACDQNGIQSVNALNDSFDQTLTELETEDQVLSKLLSTLDSRSS